MRKILIDIIISQEQLVYVLNGGVLENTTENEVNKYTIRLKLDDSIPKQEKKNICVG